MSIRSKIINASKLLYKPSYRWLYLASLGRYNHWDDKKYLEKAFECIMGKGLDLDNPRTFNEKLQWLKLYDRKPEYTIMVDKYAVKKYVADIIGEEYIIPTLGVWNHFDEIDFDKLPNQFVLKCTHDSGGVVICQDKNKLDLKSAKKKIEKCLKRNYYWFSREWPYKNVRPRIIAEEYMEDSKYGSLTDYKFFCFNGKMKCLYISIGSHTTKQQLQFFDRNFNMLPIKRSDYLDFDKIPEKPFHLDDMIALAEKLSRDIPHTRIDFYYIHNRIYFGEITFFTGSGFIPFNDKKWDYKLGRWLKLPEKNF